MVYAGSVEYFCRKFIFVGQHSKSDSRGTGRKFRYKNYILTARNRWNSSDVSIAADIVLLDFNRMIDKLPINGIKIDFKKLELITDTVFQLGYAVDNKKTRLEVDNPFSSW